jgi:hypothetical protein
LNDGLKKGVENSLAKVTFGGAGVSIGRTFEFEFNLSL